MWLLLAIVVTAPSLQEQFCNGFRAGWQSGWCHDQLSTCPQQPVPPCPPMKVVQGKKPGDTGRDAGFVDGMNARRRMPGSGGTPKVPRR